MGSSPSTSSICPSTHNIWFYFFNFCREGGVLGGGSSPSTPPLHLSQRPQFFLYFFDFYGGPLRLFQHPQYFFYFWWGSWEVGSSPSTPLHLSQQAQFFIYFFVFYGGPLRLSQHPQYFFFIFLSGSWKVGSFPSTLW